jgi:hypothetical protein
MFVEELGEPGVDAVDGDHQHIPQIGELSCASLPNKKNQRWAEEWGQTWSTCEEETMELTPCYTAMTLLLHC